MIDIYGLDAEMAAVALVPEEVDGLLEPEVAAHPHADVIHPVDRATRAALTAAILAAYDEFARAT